MADTDTDALLNNQGGDAAAQGAEGKPEKAPASADNADARFLLDFKDRGEAEKAFKEEQAKITTLAQEKATLQARLEHLESQNKPTPRNTEDWEKEVVERRREVATRIANSNGNPYEDMLEIVHASDMDVLNATIRRIEELEHKIGEQVQSYDPRYVQHRETVDRLMKDYGVTRQQATAMVEKEFSRGNGPQRAQVPGRPKAGKAGGDEGDGLPVELSKDELDFVESSGLPAESQKRMIAEMKATLAKKAKGE